GRVLVSVPAAGSMLALSSDGSRLAKLAPVKEEPAVTVWDTHTGDLVRSMRGDVRAAEELALSHDGAFVAAMVPGKPLMVFSLKEAGRVVQLPPHQGPVAGIAFSPIASEVAISGADGAVAVWDLATRRELAKIPAPRAGPGAGPAAEDRNFPDAEVERIPVP